MAKREITATPAEIAHYEDVMERIVAVTGAKTQVQLAAALGVRQSSISDAKRRASIPAEWLLKLERKYGVIAVWCETGSGPQFIAGSNEVVLLEFRARLADIIEDVKGLVGTYSNHLEVLNMTEAELQRKKNEAVDGVRDGATQARGVLSRLYNLDADVARKV